MATLPDDTMFGEPKYWQLRTSLLRAIEEDFSSGDILPNERDLAARFGVARATLRHALEQLELEGRLVRKRGAGTTVAGPRVDVSLSADGEGWPGVDLRDREVIDIATVPVTDDFAATLKGRPSALVHRLRRRQFSMRQVVGVEYLYVSRSVVPSLSTRLPGFERASLMLRQLRENRLETRHRAVELGVAEAEEARFLERPPGTTVLIVTTTYTTLGRTAAITVATYRADTCRLGFAEAGPTALRPAS
ncbi:GntR family transcriptional regulator [Streptomyces sp. SID3343]|uniref:GntR family transcriptional regulator n=1 Tax=Streptomyces sp. SID3343 TaxID=2690260 RepID=UPI00136F7FEC|nr:GntR family transcriptional regulator [Streptomyces sp. SID3343]MYW04122.1 GntR family transcriptional regulator [Streptomyces sp. SID3343]